MADKIRLLSEFVANQIAAGEVVNRPASVVKEMVENAVDAGAQSITVAIKDGGRREIKIVDDGCGMSTADARMAFDRHATSKINEADDLYRLGTFGFRGEALASIASVAEVQLKTRRASDELGTEVEIAGGKFVDQQPVSCAAGSAFTVRNIFYNVPARKRFLDRSTTEFRHIMSEYQRVALCHPELEFALWDDDKQVSRLPAAPLKQRIVGVVGPKIAKDLLPASANTTIVSVEGFVGRPTTARISNKEQFLFVNGRYFRSPYFHKAVVKAYEKLIPHNTQPSYFLYLTVDPAQIDVNVHPQKTEIKFEEGLQIWQILSAATREALAKSGVLPPLDFTLDEDVQIPVLRSGVSYKAPSLSGNPDFNPFNEPSVFENRAGMSGSSAGFVNGMRTERAPNYADGAESSAGYYIEDLDDDELEFIERGGEVQGRLALDSDAAKSPVLRVGRRWAATVRENGLLLVDLRRAREAIFYARYLATLSGGGVACQQLLFPEEVTLSTDDATLLAERMADFVALGFDIAMRDTHTAVIRGVPSDFAGGSVEQVIYELLDGIGDDQDRRRERLAAAMARVAAQESDNDDVHCVVAALDTLPPTSGSAIMKFLSEEEIEQIIH